MMSRLPGSERGRQVCCLLPLKCKSQPWCLLSTGARKSGSKFSVFSSWTFSCGMGLVWAEWECGTDALLFCNSSKLLNKPADLPSVAGEIHTRSVILPFSDKGTHWGFPGKPSYIIFAALAFLAQTTFLSVSNHFLHPCCYFYLCLTFSHVVMSFKYD